MHDKNNFETEIDFKTLPKSPSRLFGWIFPYYTVLFLIVGIYFVKNMDEASFSKVPAIYTDSLAIDVNVEVKKGGIMPAVDLKIISNPTLELIEKGKSQYNTICASCHGNEGNGDGPAASALNPPPRNFHKTEGWTNGREFNQMYNSLQKGIAGTGMVAYEYIPVEDRIAILNYIRTFAEYPIVSEQQILELDKIYELSKGVVTPSNITLEMAKTKITEENSNLTKEIQNAINKLQLSENKNGLVLFNKYVMDKEKAVLFFKRELNKNYTEQDFVNRLINFPVQNGFKSEVSYLSKEEFSNLYKLLNYSVS